MTQITANEFIKNNSNLDFERLFTTTTINQLNGVLFLEHISLSHLPILLSKIALENIELLARKAHNITLRDFGKVVFLYAPLYAANFCENECLYCGFKASNKIVRRKLDASEFKEEAIALSAKGIRDVLLLSGESRVKTPPEYLVECVNTLKKYFSSISIEVYPLQELEYAQLINAGVDGLAIYQETYDEVVYEKMHKAGPKRDFLYRLNAPERACMAGIRSVSMGALLGLSNPKKDVFMLAAHILYLQSKFPWVDFSFSLPRIRPQSGGYQPDHIVSDKLFTQLLLALRIMFPRVGINMSTRENAQLRKNLIGLGVTRMSAGSKTEVGGYASCGKSEGQFEISDESSIEAVCSTITECGYAPVFKDWQTL
ncbi:MAG: 2-iminoacetate synthase ThiH [Endomicrobiales bacterium]|nr:2-iminoacetate synthase ThiH [Endomicrobiales bacterium]